MKTLSTLATTLALLTPTVALANPVMHSVGRSSGFANEEICYRFEYREEYVPGTSVSPGYVTNKRDKVEVACANKVGVEPDVSQYPTRAPSTNTNRPVGAVSGSGTKADPWITPHPHGAPSQASHYADRTPVHLAHGYYPPYQAASGGPTIINNDRSYRQPYQQQQPPQAYESRASVPEGDTNSCASGTILGALAGGAAGAGLSSGNDLYWSIPLGMIGGSMVGCQMNGG